MCGTKVHRTLPIGSRCGSDNGGHRSCGRYKNVFMIPVTKAVGYDLFVDGCRIFVGKFGNLLKREPFLLLLPEGREKHTTDI